MKPAPWRVLIVDDDPDILALTRAMLADLHFEDRPIELLEADSAAVARSLLQAQADIAVVLLDVVMETQNAGLDLARSIREELHLPLIRVILRTARPDQAPPRASVERFEIDAYCDKTEPDADKLITPLTAALRTHRILHTLDQQRLQLERTLRERDAMELQLRQAQKLEAVGRLGAGIAHEINTPIQFISDNCHFAATAADDLLVLQETQQALLEQLIQDAPMADEIRRRWQAARQQADLDFIASELPAALQRSLDGLQRIAGIVQVMKDFSHPGQADAETGELNRIIRSTLTVAAHELRQVADTEIDLGAIAPLVCYPGALGQALLNLISNAAQAMAGQSVRGRLRVRSWQEGDQACVEIRDTGPGIPPDIREQIFDPFFTTKPFGEGSGQGLAIAHSVIVRQHGGSLMLADDGPGACFRIRLPVAGPG